MYNGVEIIAEVKTMSPSGFKSSEGFWDLFDIASSIGDIVAIHTDRRWGGSFDSITKAKNLAPKSYILAKGFHSTDEEVKRALDAGADYVLVVGRVPQLYSKKCFIEPICLDQLYGLGWKHKIVWNARDLSSLLVDKPKKETFEEARKIWLGWLCQASYIKTVADIKPGANAVLVGSNLKEFARSMGYKC